ncbi:MAG: VOC family protein [Gammaproteobacteria bacterium]|nr:VOC family protein [Gammaproteobacteria bacterium]MBK8306056.1 VOC family protein [Gammaproteobacteria bacterium]
MIGYVTIGTNDFARACAFYDALLGEMGGKRFMEMERLIIWGTEPGAPMFAVCKPYDGKPATAGNGTMVALNAGTREMADKLHAKALALGATDEGAPGPRGEGFYGGYFRDPDGNKFVAFVMG